jgi:hypothetical protein
MDAEQLALYRQCTGRTTPPDKPFLAAWLICGRRGGKSFTLALISVYLAATGDFTAYLAPGERATVMIVATDRKQARTILRYIKGILKDVPALSGLIEAETAERVDLNNGITIEVATASFRTVRGYTVACFLGDEAAFWADDSSANPADELIAAVRPAMATIPNSVMLIASTPYSRRGPLWEAYREHHGKDDAPELVWVADTRTMNPTVPESFIAREYEKDAASAAAEYGAQWRSDLEPFVGLDAVRACIQPGIRERLPERRLRYWAFVDPSGGSSDAMTLAIAHKEGDTAILDCLRERRPPFSPEALVEEFAGVLRAYRLTSVTGDRYGGEWPREQFRKHGINYELSEQTKSQLYVDLLPLINSTAVDLLDNGRLVAELVGLERRTARGGRESIDHAPGRHDDVANVAAGALTLALRKPSSWRRDRQALPPPIKIPSMATTPHTRGTGSMSR